MKNKTSFNSSHRWFQFLLSAIMILSLLAGCRLPWQPSPDDNTMDVGISDAEPMEIATAVPRRDLPPALVEVAPRPDSFIPLNESISLFFNQPMDTVSVEAALHFEPRISGRFNWENDQIVTFTPDQPLAADSTLRLSLNTSAQAVNKKNMQEAVTLDYFTAKYLQVVQTVPSEGSQNVDPESVVFVAFNQPVVSLGENGQRAEAAFTLTPNVSGSGEWLNTSTYVFTPDPSMDGGSAYTIELNETLMSTSGSGLAPSQDHNFSFETTLPSVLNILPLPEKNLSLDGPIKIQFNIRMDPQSVEDHFNLIKFGGTKVNGSFEWDQDYKKVTFIPYANLDRNTRYIIRLDQGAKSMGGILIDTASEVALTTFPAFSTETASAPDFETYYGEYGQYKINFTTPIDPDAYDEHVGIQPEVNAQNTFLSDGGMSMIITGYFDAETRYTITLDAGLRDIWGGRLGGDVTYDFVTPPANPFFSVVTGDLGHNLVFVPASVSELVLQATNIDTLSLEISPISINDLITLLHPDNYNYRQVFLPEYLEETTHNLDLEKNINEVVSIPLSFEGGPLTPGVYFLGISSPDILGDTFQNYRKLYLIVSENNLVMKVSPDQVFAWLTQLGDYNPISDAPISVYTTEGDIIARGRTNNEGLFEHGITGFDKPYSNFFSLVSEPGEADFAFTISTWGQSYSLYEMGIILDMLPTRTNAYIYTDRPIYRPGDDVNFKAAVFGRDNGVPVQSDLEVVTVSIYGEAGTSGIPATLYSEELSLSRFGTIEGMVALPEDAPTGMYRIQLTTGEDTIDVFYFDVAAYRKPEFDLRVGLDPSEIIAGENLIAEVQADYFFGLPVSGQSLDWRLFSEIQNFNLPGYQVGPLNTAWLMPRVQEYPPIGNLITSGDGETNEEGEYIIEISLQDLSLQDLPTGSLQKYSLEVTVMDSSGLPVSYNESALVHPEAFYIGVQPAAYFGRAGSPFTYSILTANWQKQAVGDIEVDATFEVIEWEIEQTLNPEMPYRYTAITTFVASASPITGPDGRARVSFTPDEPGTYLLTLKSGNAVTEVIVWVAGSGSAVWPRQSQNLIKLTADSDTYQPGQIAEIFFPNPFGEVAQALVTTERGRVMETQVLAVEGAGTSFSVPITADSVPNVYVSVLLLGKNDNGLPDYRQGIISLPVAPISKTLNVDLTLSQTETEPGDRVSATILITDPQGNPVQGEFSVAMVDKAVLALVKPTSPPILEAFYGEQPLSVQTSFSLKTFATQLALSGMDVGRGGGGDHSIQSTLRDEFPDTAFWQADVVTGVDGTARFEIPIPDSLTTWVVAVRGLTEEYLVGQTETEILTQKDLMIRPLTPRFLVDGDIIEMAAIVHNNTPELLEVDVSLQSIGFSLDDDAVMTQRVIIDSRESVRVSWWGTVESVENVDLVFEAVSGVFTDATKPVWGDLQVIRYAMPQTFSTAGQLTEAGQRLELISLPISTDPSSGELTIELNPSLTTALVSGIQSLEQTRYHDTVSTLSSLLANLSAAQALNNLGIDSPELQANLKVLVNEEIINLLEAQNYDGGWSWWGTKGINSPSSDPFITAYVLMGLEQASESGIDIAEHFINQAREYLIDQLVQPANIDSGVMLDRLAFKTYALRNSGFDLDQALDGLYARRSELSSWALALLSLSIRESDGSNTRVNVLLGDLESRAVRSATGVHWESGRASWMLPGTPIFNTAVSVFALSQLDPASTSLPQAVQYLMVHRKPDGLWSSTFESAWVLMAVTGALQGTGDYQADFEFQAALNDRLIAEGLALGTLPQASVTASTPIASLHPNSPNALLIERGAGSGTLYYRVDLQTYQPASSATALNRGISLQRDYYLAESGCPGAGDCTPIESLTLDPDDPSQIIVVALTLTVSNDLVNFMLEDYFPAGTEVINRGFLTSQTLAKDPVPVFNPRAPFENGWGWWYFSEPQIYDDHLLWIAARLPAGIYTLTYELLPFQRGTYQVLPAHAWQYFYPEVQGTSSGDIFIIE